MIQRTRLPWKRRGHHHAQIHFPPLTAEQALLVAKLLERVVDAIWRTHGDAMADLLACCDPDDTLLEAPQPLRPDAPGLSDDDDNIF
jgi:hypothetical protein